MMEWNCSGSTANSKKDRRPAPWGGSHYYRLYNGSGRSTFDFAMPGFSAKLVESRQTGETLFEHCEPNHRIIITLEGTSDATVAEVESGATVTRPDCAGCITIVPAETHRRVILTNPALSLLTIAVAPDFAGGAPAGIPLVQNGRDDWLWRAGTAFRSAAEAGNAGLAHEGLALAIARHVLRLGGSSRRVATGLDPAALRRIIALMHDRLADALSLDDLARECGLSVSALGRAFRQSTGTTPHRYLTRLRMDQAKALLRRKTLPLAQIAGAVGYSDQAHFTTAFARHTGVPPARWRQSNLP